MFMTITAFQRGTPCSLTVGTKVFLEYASSILRVEEEPTREKGRTHISVDKQQLRSTPFGTLTAVFICARSLQI